MLQKVWFTSALNPELATWHGNLYNAYPILSLIGQAIPLLRVLRKPRIWGSSHKTPVEVLKVEVQDSNGSIIVGCSRLAVQVGLRRDLEG